VLGKLARIGTNDSQQRERRRQKSQLITPELILHVHATVLAQPLAAQLGR
jgi:hypothetical protein